MRKFLLVFFMAVSGFQISFAQNLSFTCPRNITVACGPPCLTLNVQFPDLRGLATDYSFVNTTANAACYPLVNPGVPGTPTSLTIDDRYSSVIPIGFNFPFYGVNQSSLVVSTNGYISFDLSKAGGFSHYGILRNVGTLSATIGTPINLPDSLYDQSLIMGPYHDLDPSVTSSPTRQIKYDVRGTTPNRKWVLSFFKIPLFLTACNSLFENTHQIILHESTGIIEIFVADKQICTGWNQGRAMIGLQDATRTKGIMAPGRTAASAPWGSIGMNETWRFIPNQGTHLYRSVELLNASATVIATGDTSRINANTFEWNFTNVCPPPNVTTLYVVKTTYEKIDNPALTIYSLDTVYILRQNSLPATITTAPTTCGASVGTLTATPSSGTSPFTYTLNGGAPVTVPGPHTFTGLAAGLYTVVITDATGCTNTLTGTVGTNSTIPGTISATLTSCPLSMDGTITVTPTGGTAPYSYSLDGGPSQPSNVFINVAPGAHTVIFTDAAGCIGTLSITVVAGNTPITASLSSTPTSCPTVSNGTITVTPTSGTAPYSYSLDGGPFVLGNVFINVPSGVHSVTIRDVFMCSGTFPITVVQGASLTSTISSVNPPCFNLNNGSITIVPTSGNAPYQYSLNGGPQQGPNTFTGLAPGAYTIVFTDAIGCTGTNSITLTTNPAITATSTNTMPLCNGNNNGSISINASGGVAPYEYSINAGTSYQTSPLFTGLIAGTYNFLLRDALGCIYPFTFVLNQPTVLTVSATNIPSSCYNNDGVITITAAGGTTTYQYSIDNGVNYVSTNIFTVPSGFYSIRVRDANNCIANTTSTVLLNDTMRLELGPDSLICKGNSITFTPQTNAQTNIFKWSTFPTFIAGEINYDTIANATITAPTDKKYYLIARWGVCTRVDSVTINILKKPVAFAGNDTTICYKTTATLTGSVSNTSGTVNYAWSPTAKLATPNTAITAAAPDSTQQYVLTVTDNYGCNFSVTDTMWVIMQPPIPAFAGNDTNAVLGRPHQLLGSGGTVYNWSPFTPLNNPFIANPLATLYNDTYFTVTITDAIGCTGTDDLFIKVYEGPTYYLPNAFSPNGDGLNDIFRPIPVGIRSTDYFRVFNRYGDLMFQTTQWLKGWDGTHKGKKASSGTYVWIIKGVDKNGRTVEMTGTVILIQ